MYVCTLEATEALTSAAPEREKYISSDYQVTICCVCCINVNISKSTCKLVPSVPGFASAKLGTIKNSGKVLVCQSIT